MSEGFLVTSRAVKNHSPCAPGWKAHLRATQKTGEDDDPISMAEIVSGNSFENALFSARALPEQRQVWRDFVAWCAGQAAIVATGSSKQARDKAAQAAQCAKQEDIWDALLRCPALAQQAAGWAAHAMGGDYKTAAAVARQQQIEDFLRRVTAA